jgi:transcriptional regulator with XRE-family HTH domain
MGRISSGIESLDTLIESLHIGDNVVWEVDAGTSYDVFVKNFIRQSFENEQKVIYVSFNRSPQSVLNEIGKSLNPEHFTLIDCFTSGKGKNDSAFLRFYDNPGTVNVVRIVNPRSIEEFTGRLSVIEDSLPPGARYVFDSLTGMQDLWGDENDTYRFFTHMCPRLFDLDTVAYWILEKDAHSQKFKANLRHITQVVFDVYKRRDSLFIRALKLAGRQDREAFKPHLYQITNGSVSISQPKKEPSADIGSRVKDMRSKLGMSQRELADKIGLTTSFISQVENNQVSPSLNSFLQIAHALGSNPSELLQEKGEPQDDRWFVRRETAAKNLHEKGPGYAIFRVVSGDDTAAYIVLLHPGADLAGHFLNYRRDEVIHVLQGSVSVKIGAVERTVERGDSVYLKEHLPSRWINRTDGEVELFVVCTS